MTMATQKTTVLYLISTLLCSMRTASGQIVYEAVILSEDSFVPTWQPVAFDCSFVNKWGIQLHPSSFPINQQIGWSPPLLVSHSSDYEMWNVGTKASAGVQAVAELGENDVLAFELYNAGGFKDVVQGIEQDLASTATQSVNDLRLDQAHPFISVISSITPSPDWFSGFPNYQPVNVTSNTWLDGFAIKTYPMDAGTDAGTVYMQNIPLSEDAKLNITQFTVETVPDTDVFLDPSQTTVPSVGTWTCVRQRAERAVQIAESPGNEKRRDIPVDRTVINLESVLGDVNVSTPVQYAVTFSGTWSDTRHPTSFPEFPSPEFSPHYIVSHSEEYQMWNPGQAASSAIAKFVEDVNGTELVQSISSAGSLVTDFITSNAAEISVEDQVVGTLSLDPDHRLISSVSKIIPSPDWFLGINNLEPVQDSRWLKEFSIDLLPFDAGTKSGITYTDPSQTIDPPNVITRITPVTFPKYTNGALPVLVNSDDVGTFIYPLGRYNFVLLTGAEPTAIATPTASPVLTPTVTSATLEPSATQSIPPSMAPVITPPSPNAPVSTPTTTLEPSATQSIPPSVAPVITPPPSTLSILTPSVTPTTSMSPTGSSDPTSPHFVPLWQPVAYDCSFVNLWTSNIHPIDYPANASWSAPFFVSHSNDYTLWQSGETTTKGIQQLAELGQSGDLVEELSNYTSSEIREILQGVSFEVLPGMQPLQNIMDFRVDEKRSRISTIASIMPSPDWFSGFSSFRPVNIDNTTWLDGFTLDTPPFDAGTDYGTSYTSPNTPANPPETIYELNRDTIPDSLVFLGSDGEAVAPVARWNCIRRLNEYLPQASEPPRRIPVAETVINEDFITSNIAVTTQAQYSVTFTSNITAERTSFIVPGDFQLSPHIVVSHNTSFELWRPGMLASAAVTQLAEDGNETGVFTEFANSGGAVLNGLRGTETVGLLNVDFEHRLISSLSHVDPSPDWFTGFTRIEPIRNSRWLESFSIDVLPFDAGTDTGELFTSEPQPLFPPNVITRITPASVPKDTPVFVTSDTEGMLVHPLGRFTFALLNTAAPTVTIAPSITPAPSQSSVPTVNSAPSQSPVPTVAQSSQAPTTSPSVELELPTISPVTDFPSLSPSIAPVNEPTLQPTNGGSNEVTLTPTSSNAGSSSTPTAVPTFTSLSPSIAPVNEPTLQPTNGGSNEVTLTPTSSNVGSSSTPTAVPTFPSLSPSIAPVNEPTLQPTNGGGNEVTLTPTSSNVGSSSTPTAAPSIATTFFTLSPTRDGSGPPLPTSRPTTEVPTPPIDPESTPNPSSAPVFDFWAYWKPNDRPAGPSPSPTAMPQPPISVPPSGSPLPDDDVLEDIDFSLRENDDVFGGFAETGPDAGPEGNDDTFVLASKGGGAFSITEIEERTTDSGVSDAQLDLSTASTKGMEEPKENGLLSSISASRRQTSPSVFLVLLLLYSYIII